MIEGLQSQVLIEQDREGTPTIKGHHILDIYRAQGWITARDRFFQMDMIRRRAQGNLSSIFGSRAHESDKLHRLFNFENVALRAYKAMEANVQNRLRAYADGVNAFLNHGELPFETRVLFYKPQKWEPHHCILVVLSMHEDLEFSLQADTEKALNLLYERRPIEVAQFLTPMGGFYDLPLFDENFEQPKIPSIHVFNLRADFSHSASTNFKLSEHASLGSNAWAVSGKKTQSGLPLLAGDPHLRLALPNIWYRNYLKGAGLDVIGVSLPGLPGIVIGTNKKIAWSLTSPYVDTVDLVKLQKNISYPVRKELIETRFSKDLLYGIKESKFGPILYEDKNYAYALQWSALDPTRFLHVDLADLNLSQNKDDLLHAAKKWSGPPQNLIFATHEGDIGWVLAGHLPKRVGFSGHTSGVRDENHYWDGYFSFEELPKLINNEKDIIVSANQRTKAIHENPHFFGNNWPSSTRAYRIHELLNEDKKSDAEHMLSIQLDIYSYLMAWYRDLLLQTLNTKNVENDPWMAHIKVILKEWDGQVSIESSAYPFLRDFRDTLLTQLIGPLWGNSDMVWNNPEPILQTLLKERPLHLLSSEFMSYDDVIIQSALSTAKKLVKQPGDLKNLRWGERNKTKVFHPFALLLPAPLKKYFELKPQELPGDSLGVPRIGGFFGDLLHSSSMRMVVDLAHPENSLFHHPGGQSGHFLSKNFSDQFENWYTGTATNLYPGKTVATDILKPKL